MNDAIKNSGRWALFRIMGISLGLLMGAQDRSAAEGLIFLDPAHGGDDLGATTKYGTEAQFVLQTALLMEVALAASSRTIRLSRRDDRFLLPAHRMVMASKAKASLILSLHLANHGNSIYGPIIYYGAGASEHKTPIAGIFPLWQTPPTALVLAKDLAKRLAVAAGLEPTRARPFPHSPWLDGTTVPVLMIELENMAETTSGGGVITAQEVADFWSSSILLLEN